MKREVKDFIRNLQDLGFKVSRTNSGHIRITRPEMRSPVFLASTPSDWRALKNARSEIRRTLRGPKVAIDF